MRVYVLVPLVFVLIYVGSAQNNLKSVLDDIDVGSKSGESLFSNLFGMFKTDPALKQIEEGGQSQALYRSIFNQLPKNRVQDQKVKEFLLKELGENKKKGENQKETLPYEVLLPRRRQPIQIKYDLVPKTFGSNEKGKEKREKRDQFYLLNQYLSKFEKSQSDEKVFWQNRQFQDRKNGGQLPFFRIFGPKGKGRGPTSIPSQEVIQKILQQRIPFLKQGKMINMVSTPHRKGVSINMEYETKQERILIILGRYRSRKHYLEIVSMKENQNPFVNKQESKSNNQDIVINEQNQKTKRPTDLAHNEHQEVKKPNQNVHISIPEEPKFDMRNPDQIVKSLKPQMTKPSQHSDPHTLNSELSKSGVKANNVEDVSSKVQPKIVKIEQKSQDKNLQKNEEKLNNNARQPLQLPPKNKQKLEDHKVDGSKETVEISKLQVQTVVKVQKIEQKQKQKQKPLKTEPLKQSVKTQQKIKQNREPTKDQKIKQASEEKSKVKSQSKIEPTSEQKNEPQIKSTTELKSITESTKTAIADTVLQKVESSNKEEAQKLSPISKQSQKNEKKQTVQLSQPKASQEKQKEIKEKVES